MEFSIATRLRQLMESRGWTENKTVALKAGVHPSTIGLLLNSGRSDPGISTVAKLAKTFGMTISQFIGEEAATAGDLEPYRAVIELARDNDMDPARLEQLLRTVMAVSRK